MLGVTGIWLLADTLLPEPATFFSIRAAWVQYTGVVAIAVMSVAMVLATRPRSIEYPLGGLDKMYRLHKWFGITGLAFAVIHWLWGQGAKWAVGWGWLTRPQSLVLWSGSAWAIAAQRPDRSWSRAQPLSSGTLPDALGPVGKEV